MSGALQDRLPVSETVATGSEQLDDLARRLVAEFRPAERWHQAVVSSTGETTDVVIGPGVLTPAVRESLFETLVIQRTAAGDLIVADPAGAAYGVGRDLSEAFAEWEEAALEHYEDLRAEEGGLAPRMFRQLLFLRKIFG